MSWVEDVKRSLSTDRGKNFAKAGASLLSGNPISAIYYGFKGATSPSVTGWGSPIQRTGVTSVYDIQNNIQPSFEPLSLNPSGSQGIPRSAMIPSEFNADLAPYVQDFVNNIQVPTDSGLQMPQEEQAQAQAPQQAPPPVAPKITPTKMPMPSDLDFITAQLDPYGQSAYQSRSAPKYVNPMTANGGYFDMNKAGTVGGKYIEGAGWMTDAAKAFGLKPEDLEFQAMMNQRIAGMYA
jgi:hypothetical protein